MNGMMRRKVEKGGTSRFKSFFYSKPQELKSIDLRTFPEYMLNTKESVKMLGVHHHFILLENGNQQRKVILSTQDLKAPQTKEVLLLDMR